MFNNAYGMVLHFPPPSFPHDKEQDWTRLNKIETKETIMQSYWFTHNTHITFNNVLLSFFIHVLHISYNKSPIGALNGTLKWGSLK